MPSQSPTAEQVEILSQSGETCRRGEDGRTAYEKLKGKPFSRAFLSFGESCLAKLNDAQVNSQTVAKLAPRWCRGVFLGYDRNSNEFIVNADSGIVKTCAVQRTPVSQRWPAKELQKVKDSPYSLYVKPPEES